MTWFRVWCRDQGQTLEMDTFSSSAEAKAYIKRTQEDFDRHPHAYSLVCPSFSITTVSQQQMNQEIADQIQYREENFAIFEI